jgi:hypothetical protein
MKQKLITGCAKKMHCIVGLVLEEKCIEYVKKRLEKKTERNAQQEMTFL